MNRQDRVPVDVELDEETVAVVAEVRDRIEEETGLWFTVEEVAQFLLDYAARELPEDPEEALAELRDVVGLDGGEVDE